MDRSSLTLLTSCHICREHVIASPLLTRDDLAVALREGWDVRLMHITEHDDHVWSLNNRERANLEVAISGELV